jgi:hypothetical protein
MKNVTPFALILFCLSTGTLAADFKFVTTDNSGTTQICLAAATDNTEVMISNLQKLSRRGTSLSYRAFINSIRCNNQFIGNFAKTYNARNTFAYLNQYTNQWNKNNQSKITVEDIAKAQNSEKTVVVLVAGN